MQTSPSAAEQLKARLIGCLDRENNVIDSGSFTSVLDELENAVMTKEALEATRLGALVNDLRRKLQSCSPDVSRRCRSIIRAWQKLCAPSTGASSSTGDPGSATASPASSVKSDYASGVKGGRVVTPKTLHNRLLISSTVSTGRVASSPVLAPKQILLNGHHKVGDYNAGNQDNLTVQHEAMPSLKIRIKMGETASIVKSTSVPCSLDKKDRTFNQQLLLTPVVESLTENSPSEAKRPKKPRQKRQLDDLVQGNLLNQQQDPLQMISQGMPLPKLKSTADLVAEMASNYPEEMARSITNAAQPSSYPVDDVIIGQDAKNRPMNGCYDMIDSVDSIGYSNPNSKYADYLNVTKAELVAKFLKSSSEAQDFVVATVDDDVITDDAPLLTVKHERPETPESIEEEEDQKDPLWTDEGMEKLSTRKAGKYNIGNLVKKTINGGDDESSHTGVQNLKTSRPKHDWYSILKPIDMSIGDDVIIENPTTSIAGKLLDQSIDTDLIQNAPDDVISLHSRLLVSFDMKSEQNNNNDNQSIIIGDGIGGKNDRKNSCIPVLAMPYVDIGLPDFLEYKYPEKQRHLAHWSER